MHLRQQSVALFFLQNEAQRQQQQKMQQNKFLLSLFSSSHDPTLYFCVLKKTLNHIFVKISDVNLLVEQKPATFTLNKMLQNLIYLLITCLLHSI